MSRRYNKKNVTPDNETNSINKQPTKTQNKKKVAFTNNDDHDDNSVISEENNENDNYSEND